MFSTSFTWIDWGIMIFCVVALRLISLSTRKYMKGVADFLSANRTAGRYLLTIAGQMGSIGAISLIATFQQIYVTGFTATWWAAMSLPVGVIMLLTGWVYYRLRETRALTMAQFLETRYNRRFRIFSGIVIWSCGILNFGIFPAVAARFFVFFCGLPQDIHLLGLAIPTFIPIMAIDLALALTFVNMGGQISIMVTECAQGIVSAFAFLVVAGVILMKVHWGDITAAAEMYAPANASMINPFHTSEMKNYNIWFYIIGIFGSFYGASSWLGTQGFMTAGRSAHEQKMGGIISLWRGFPLALFLLILPLAAFAVLHLDKYAAIAHQATLVMNSIPNENIMSEMRVPLVMAYLLPVGIKGLLATVMLFFSFTCHDTYMHSWGSIFIQDIVMPLRRRPTTPEQHVKWLRWSILFVALFAFVFSILYKPTMDILMFFAITGTIWAGGSGAVIIGGLYWRKGTTAAAYVSLILGSVVGVGGLIVDRYWPDWFGKPFPINGQWLWMWAMLGSIVVYVIVSYLTCKGREFNIERLLHRGKYKIASDHRDEPVEEQYPNVWLKIVGITSEFTIYDRILAVAAVAWNTIWFLNFIAATAYHLFVAPLSTLWFMKFWKFYVALYFVMAIPSTIWFTVGGVLDIKALFRDLKTAVRDHTDDGRVVHEADDYVSIDKQPSHSLEATLEMAAESPLPATDGETD